MTETSIKDNSMYEFKKICFEICPQNGTEKVKIWQKVGNLLSENAEAITKDIQ